MNKYSPSEDKYDFKVWELRRVKVMEMVKKHNIKRILDIGCGEGKLLTYLLSLEIGVKELTGIDIDKASLKKAKLEIQNQIKLIKIDRKKSINICPELSMKIRVNLFNYNLLHKTEYFRKRFLNIDMLTFIEVIEHLNLPDAQNCLDILLGLYRPKFLIVTTPNKDFNVKFGMKDHQVRNVDHKFEWSRKEFQLICSKFSEKYDYNLQFDGVGYYHEEYGHSTQICYFSIKNKACFSLIKNLNNIEKIKAYYTIKYIDNNKNSEIKKSVIGYQLTNAYNYCLNKNICESDFVDFKLIYSYYGIKNIFQSFQDFLNAVSSMDLFEYSIEINHELGLRYRPPQDSDENILD